MLCSSQVLKKHPEVTSIEGTSFTKGVFPKSCKGEAGGSLWVPKFSNDVAVVDAVQIRIVLVWNEGSTQMQGLGMHIV